jgi:two-component system phosphate regulon response regulator PhoB
MAKEQILVVDDEEDLLELIGYNLTKEGYRVVSAATGEEAVSKARSLLPGLIVLDLLLPNVDGLEVCRTLKADARTRHIPIVMLTAKAEEIDVVAGLEVGADDYVTKPFSPRVLLARIKAVLRRRAREQSDDAAVIKVENLVIDPIRHDVTLAGKSLPLTFTEFRLLQMLAQRRGRAFTRLQIVDAVMGEDYPVTERSVDVHVAGLRKKLGPMGGRIETVRGVGYRFKE